MNHPGVFGCVFADQQGLCLGGKYFTKCVIFCIICSFVAKGKASTDSAGIITAIAEQAAKLDPSNKPPVIHFENDNNSCIINKAGVTVAIFKNNQS